MATPIGDYTGDTDVRPSLRPLAPVLVLLGGAWLSAAAMILIRLV